MIIIIGLIDLLILVGVMFFEPYVLMMLFNWFAVPAFGLQPLSYGLAWGIGLLFSFITMGIGEINYSGNNITDDPAENLAEFFAIGAVGLVINAIALGIGALIAVIIGVF